MEWTKTLGPYIWPKIVACSAHCNWSNAVFLQGHFSKRHTGNSIMHTNSEHTLMECASLVCLLYRWWTIVTLNIICDTNEKWNRVNIRETLQGSEWHYVLLKRSGTWMQNQFWPSINNLSNCLSLRCTLLVPSASQWQFTYPHSIPG